jgi:predicted HAD superfamily hydrolase
MEGKPMRLSITDLLTQLKVYKQIEIVSFDIFDTLLFRTVKRPVDVFEIVAQRANKDGLTPTYISELEFKNLRVEAEKRARSYKKLQEGTEEVSLQEIYSHMPRIISNRDKLAILEVETEKEICFINPMIKDLIKKLVLEGKKVILTSDMYLSEKQITEILEHNSMNVSDISHIFISYEQRKSKYKGNMYPYILEQINVKANQMIHIGDNYTSDIINAEQWGINTIYYDVISGDKFLNLELEALKYGNLVPQVYALRRYVASLKNDLSEEQKKWFNIGVIILGPLLTGGAEWVLDVARENTITNVYPLMREGKLLGRLLGQAQAYREEENVIKPLYISRKSIFLPSIKKVDEEMISDLFNIKKVTIGNVFEMLKIQEYNGEFLKYLGVEIKEAKKIEYEGKRLDEYLKEYLLSKSVIAGIENSIENSTQLIKGYLDSLGIDKPFLTIDIGFKGTIQKGIEKTLDKIDIDNLNVHLLIFGHDTCMKNIFEDIDIRGYVGNWGMNEDIITPIFRSPYILEQLMMCDEGTTIGYKKENNEYIPCTKVVENMTQQQLEYINLCQEGILFYQKHFLELARQKERLREVKNEVRQLTQIVLRMMNFPTLEEAKTLSNLSHDENFGADSVHKICDQDHLDMIKEKGVDYFCKSTLPEEVLWLEGLMVQADPTYYINKLVDNNESHYEKSILQLVRNVTIHKPKCVVIIGAGEAGRTVYKYLQIYGIQVEAFIDNNKKLQGHDINNVPIKAMTDTFISESYVIASFAYVYELLKQAEQILGPNVKLYYHGQDKLKETV